MGGVPENIFDMLTNADLKFGSVTDENGNSVELSYGRYVSLLRSPDQAVRKNAFETFFDSYLSMKNTLAASFSASVKKDVFFKKP